MTTSRLQSVFATVARSVFALFFICGGIFHFVQPTFYLRMMPPYLPAPLELIYVSGIAEIALGLLLLMMPRAHRLAGWGLVALLLAVFPANIYMAMHPELFPEFSAAVMLWVRLPLQGVLIAWAYYYTRRRHA